MRSCHSAIKRDVASFCRELLEIPVAWPEMSVIVSSWFLEVAVRGS